MQMPDEDKIVRNVRQQPLPLLDTAILARQASCKPFCSTCGWSPNAICMWQQCLDVIRDAACGPTAVYAWLGVAHKTSKQMKMEDCYSTVKGSSGLAAPRYIARRVQHERDGFWGVIPIGFIYQLQAVSSQANPSWSGPFAVVLHQI